MRPTTTWCAFTFDVCLKQHTVTIYLPQVVKLFVAHMSEQMLVQRWKAASFLRGPVVKSLGGDANTPNDILFVRLSDGMDHFNEGPKSPLT